MTAISSLLITIFLFVSDTLNTAYGESWDGVQASEQGNVFMQAMASNNLIFVVLGVSLIIWFVLAAYLIRLEKKLDKLEKRMEGS
ncbi:hypothetical protein QA596_09830 [Balneolales bacterium ANBcel1]|nr:hypothetical protein [Balneolales bacterium ANBcel1]